MKHTDLEKTRKITETITDLSIETDHQHITETDRQHVTETDRQQITETDRQTDTHKCQEAITVQHATVYKTVSVINAVA